MKIKQIICTGLAFAALLSGLWACKDDEVTAKNPPQVLYHSAELVVDLNQTTTPAIIAVINSETGLKSVTTYILKEEGVVEQLDLPETRFYNPHSYSLRKTPIYTEDMIGIRIVAVDLAGQQLVSELPLRVIPLVALPEVWFTDADGNPIDSYIHYQGDPMPEIRVRAEGQEDLKTLSSFQVLNSSVQQIVDVIELPAGQQSIDMSLQDLDEGFEFNSRIMAIKMKVTAGALNRGREATLPVSIVKAVSLGFDQDDQAFNGLAIDGTFTVSGWVDFLQPFKEVTYTLLDRKRQDMGGGAQLLATTPDGDSKVTFSENLIADVNLGYIVVKAELESGKTDTYEIPVHVGYKYWHLVTSAGGAAANNDATPNNPLVLNSTDGVMYSLCEGMADWQNADVGFGAWGELRLQSLYNGSNKLQSANCSIYGTPTWPNRKLYSVAQAKNTTPETFMQVTATDLAAETAKETPGNSAKLTGTMLEEEGRKTFYVCYYEKDSNTVPSTKKKVIVCVDQIQNWNYDSSKTGYHSWCRSTFWIHVKTQI